MIDIPPSMKPQTDTATIKWMRHLLPHKTLSNTFTDMLISKENQEPFIIRLLEDQKLLSSIAKNSGPTYQYPSSSKQLKPELLYNTTELSKLCQMRDIFLEFDADRSRTLEIKELLFMFNSNGIPITAEELVELFTESGKKKKNVWEYKISFLDFIKFALDYECEEKFRKIKEKIQQRHNNKLFIPLTLAHCFDYIFKKEKIKGCINKIDKGIRKVEKLGKNKKVNLGGNLMLKKIGITNDVNVVKICKCFKDVIETSKSNLEKIQKEIAFRKFHSTNHKLKSSSSRKNNKYLKYLKRLNDINEENYSARNLKQSFDLKYKTISNFKKNVPHVFTPEKNQSHFSLTYFNKTSRCVDKSNKIFKTSYKTFVKSRINKNHPQSRNREVFSYVGGDSLTNSSVKKNINCSLQQLMYKTLTKIKPKNLKISIS